MTGWLIGIPIVSAVVALAYWLCRWRVRQIDKADAKIFAERIPAWTQPAEAFDAETRNAKIVASKRRSERRQTQRLKAEAAQVTPKQQKPPATVADIRSRRRGA